MFRTVENQTIRRADGSIDYDHYRAEAERQRAQAMRKALAQLWFWASDPRARFENIDAPELRLHVVKE